MIKPPKFIFFKPENRGNFRFQTLTNGFCAILLFLDNKQTSLIEWKLNLSYIIKIESVVLNALRKCFLALLSFNYVLVYWLFWWFWPITGSVHVGQWQLQSKFWRWKICERSSWWPPYLHSAAVHWTLSTMSVHRHIAGKVIHISFGSFFDPHYPLQ